MKTGAIIASLFFVGSLVSCSQCYECTHDVEILNQSTGQVETEEVSEDFCTASPAELEDKEANGFTCTQRLGI
jgi:hypothetical protein